jgi:hypothetical protein
MPYPPRLYPTLALHLTPPHSLIFLPSLAHRWELFCAHTRLPSGLLVRSLATNETRILSLSQSVIACDASQDWRKRWGDLRLDVLWLSTTGVSMRPSLQTGDQVALIPLRWPEIRIGQIIVFALEHRWIIHRVTSLSPKPPSMLQRVTHTWSGVLHLPSCPAPDDPHIWRCWTRGDNRPDLDAPLHTHQILGLVTQAKRHNKPLPINTFTQRAYNALRETKRLLTRSIPKS